MARKKEYRVRYSTGEHTALLTRREAEGLFGSFKTGKHRAVQIIKEKDIKRRD